MDLVLVVCCIVMSEPEYPRRLRWDLHGGAGIAVEEILTFARLRDDVRERRLHQHRAVLVIIASLCANVARHST